MAQGSSSSYKNIERHIKDGLTIKAIAQREGMNELATRRIVNSLCPGYTPTVEDTLPYGLTQATSSLRIRLGNELYDLRSRLKCDRTEVARLVGLNRREQIRAEQRPYSHDWTISQIERLTRVTGTTMEDILNGSNS